MSQQPVSGCDSCGNAAHCVGSSWAHAMQDEDSGVLAPVRRSLAAARHLFWANDRPATLYILRRGTFKSLRYGRDGEVQVTGFYFSGDALGVDMLLHGKVRDSVIALEDSEVCMIPLPALRRMRWRSEVLLDRIQGALGIEFIRLETRLWLDRLNAEPRLAAFLLWLAGAMTSTEAVSPCRFELPMSHQDIGNYLCLAPETVSRLFARLQGRGLLTLHRRRIVRLLDVPALQRLAESDGALAPSRRHPVVDNPQAELVVD